MTRHFAVPDAVQQSQARREAARNKPVQCAGEAGRCRRPARHSCARYGGAWCPGHWAELPRSVPTPDPTRTLDALQQRMRAQLQHGSAA